MALLHGLPFPNFNSALHQSLPFHLPRYTYSPQTLPLPHFSHLRCSLSPSISVLYKAISRLWQFSRLFNATSESSNCKFAVNQILVDDDSMPHSPATPHKLGNRAVEASPNPSVSLTEKLTSKVKQASSLHEPSPASTYGDTAGSSNPATPQDNPSHGMLTKPL